MPIDKLTTDKDALIVTRTVTVRHEQGLHARPAEMIVRHARKFAAEIQLGRERHHVDCKSILNILTLGAAQGTELLLTANGADAQQALDALAPLIESDFTEVVGPVPTPAASLVEAVEPTR